MASLIIAYISWVLHWPWGLGVTSKSVLRSLVIVSLLRIVRNNSLLLTAATANADADGDDNYDRHYYHDNNKDDVFYADTLRVGVIPINLRD